MKFQAPKGMRDYYPDLMALRNWVMDCWRRVSRRCGFEEYDGPIFEDLDLYRVKSGEGIVSELFHFQDRGGREMAIRPEMTPTLARMVAARAQALRKPIKWYSVPRLCRAERPQRGRLREFFQWNIDILGEDGPEADAECIFVALDFFRELGLSAEQVTLKLNSRSVLAAILRIKGFDPARLDGVYAVLDKRDKLPDEAFRVAIDKLGVTAGQRDVLIRLGDAKGPEGLVVVGDLVGDDDEGRSRLSELGRIFEVLNHMDVGPFCRFDMGVVRGLAYYTGPVFEAFGRGGLQRAVCGGGRYDRLLENVGGPPMSGVGFATSDVVILDLLEEFSLLPSPQSRIDVFIANADPDSAEAGRIVLAVASELRRKNVSALYAYHPPALGKQLKLANERGAARVLIVDRDTVTGGAATLKDMTDGRQVSLPLRSAIDDPFLPLDPVP
jgi:histidyl-tRNA synthetase